MRAKPPHRRVFMQQRRHSLSGVAPLARTAQDDQLLLEQKILRDHRSHATGATQRRGHDGPVKQGEQEGFHARDSVGQTSGATQRCLNLGFSERIGIRDAQPYATSGQRRRALRPWLRYYNHDRPHASLNYQPPSSRLQSAA